MGEMITIHDDNWQEFVEPIIDGEHRSRGLVARNYMTHPFGCMGALAPAFDLPLLDEAQIDEEIARQEEEKSSIQHIRDRAGIAALDQNGQGYCWAYSSTGAMILVRAVAGLPYVPLSGHMIGCLIKGYRDQGGNGIDSMQFIADNGVCSQEHWPQDSMSRSNDTPAMRANAKLHRYTEWMECSEDAQLRRRQIMTALILNLPVVGDFNWWGHSVAIMRLMSRTKTRILNSWSNSWSQNGAGDLEGGRAFPDNAWVARVPTATLV